MKLERALSDPEQVRALPTQHLSDKTTTVSGTAHDLFDRNIAFSHANNHRIGLFTAQEALVLKAFSRGQQVGIDRSRADRATDLSHGFAHRIEKSVAGVFHEVPAVSDLRGMRQGLGCRERIAAAPIARDDLNLRLIRKPELGRRRLAIGQQCDCLAPFEITDDRAVTLVALPRPVIDTDDGRRQKARGAAPSDNTQQRIVAHWQHQSPCEGRRWATAQRKPEMVHDMIKPGRSPPPRREKAAIKALGENAPTA
jgi:hypothetical protein